MVAGAATWSDNASTYWAHLGSLSGQDIEAIAFLVLMQAAKETQEDLKAIMAKVKCTRVEKLADGAVVYAEAENVVDPSETYVLKVIDRAIGSRGILPDEAGVVRPPRPVPADDEYCGAYHVATAVVVGDFRAL